MPPLKKKSPVKPGKKERQGNSFMAKRRPGHSDSEQPIASNFDINKNIGDKKYRLEAYSVNVVYSLTA